MDGNDRRQRQSGNPAGQQQYQPQPGLIQSPPQFAAASASTDSRFRQPQIPTSAPGAQRQGNVQQPGYGYAQYAEGSQFAGSSMHAGAGGMQYGTEYQPEQRAQQTYQQYPTNMEGIQVYGVPQQQAAQSSPYAQVPSYQQDPYGSQQAYYAPGPTSAPAASLPGGGVPSQYVSMNYGTQSPSTSYQVDATQPPYYPPSATQQAELEAAYAQYQHELRRTFECVRDKRLVDAGQLVMRISDWLSMNAEGLGFTRDDEATHADRLRLWAEFNTCWLSTLQAQKDMTTQMLDTGQTSVPPPQSMLDQDLMETMGKELIRLCDTMEKHGLVDYQMGVWEEEIIVLLMQCLDLCIELRENQGTTQTATASGSQQQSTSGVSQQRSR